MLPDRQDHSPADPNWRWTGQRTDEPKNAAAGAQARRAAFNTLEEFAAWRRSKGFPDISQHDLERAFARFKGDPVYELAISEPVVERR
jgi:hypothetical protein